MNYIKEQCEIDVFVSGEAAVSIQRSGLEKLWDRGDVPLSILETGGRIKLVNCCLYAHYCVSLQHLIIEQKRLELLQICTSVTLFAEQ